MKYDLLIRSGTVVREDGVERADIAVSDEKIVEVAPDLPGDARETIDATGLHVFPGLIDPHVHFNEPGRTDWEGFATGSAALAAGGGTMFFDMPLNSSPPVLDGPSFDLKLESAKKSSLTDFALWGGLTPKNLDRMEELAERGVVGFKAFMCDSGIEDFPYADDATLLDGMRRAARLRLPVAVHAENHEETAARTRRALAEGRTSVHDWLATRPPHAEMEAIYRAMELARDSGCSLHVVHVSSPAFAGRIRSESMAEGIDATCETCPHYLAFNRDDHTRLGAIAKCAPPLRDEATRERMWSALRGGSVDWIASDHSPAPDSMKSSSNFFEVWGGIAGVQSTLQILLTPKDGLALEDVARLTAGAPPRRFKVQAKGQIDADYDADVTLVDLNATFQLRRENLLDRHRLSPYVGRTFRGVIRRTILRGRTIFMDGKTIGPPSGKFVRPAR
jgi:allantoinase